MGLFLRHAVKIKPGVDARMAPRDALPQAAIKLRQSRRLFGCLGLVTGALRRRLARRLIGRNAKLSVAAQRRYPARYSPPQRSFVVA
jgi:hypothetical protein